jgi:hypothetical protein
LFVVYGSKGPRGCQGHSGLHPEFFFPVDVDRRGRVTSTCALICPSVCFYPTTTTARANTSSALYVINV